MRLIALLALVACGGGTATPDARPIDAIAKTVVEVGCPATPDATVMTVDTVDAFMPNAVTISVGGIVKFMTSSAHNVVPNPLTTSDSGLTVNFNTTKCLKFTASGTFGFMCQPHGFTGTVTVN